MSVIPRDFLDDDDDSYITNLAPTLDEAEMQDFPINLAALDTAKIPFQLIKANEWKGIVKLIDPLHLLGLYQLLSLAVTKTWEFVQKEAQNDAKPDENGTIPSIVYPTNANPPVTIEAPVGSSENEYMTFQMTEVLTSQILPLFGMMVMKVHWKTNGERFEYRFRLGAKPLRVYDALVLMLDINQVLALPNAISSEDIAGRLYLGLLTTMLKRNNLIKVDEPNNNDDDSQDDGDDSAQLANPGVQNDYSPLWFEMSQFDVLINYSTQPRPTTTTTTSTDDNKSQDSTDSIAEKVIPLNNHPRKVDDVDFTNPIAMYNYFGQRTHNLYVEILNNIVINYERNLILLTIPCQDYALPLRTLPKSTTTTTKPTSTANNKNAAAVAAIKAKQAAKASGVTTPATKPAAKAPAPRPTTTAPVAPANANIITQPVDFPILPLHADLFTLLPNILITVIKAIVTFKIKQAQSDHVVLQREAAQNTVDTPSQEEQKEQMNDEDEDDEYYHPKAQKPTKKLMNLSTIHKFASLFKFLTKNKPSYTPQELLSTWVTLTDETNGEDQQALLSKQMSSMVITPKCLQPKPDTTKAMTTSTNSMNADDTKSEQTPEQDNNPQGAGQKEEEEEPDFDSFALSISLSLAQSYIHHGLVHANKVFINGFERQQEKLRQQSL